MQMTQSLDYPITQSTNGDLDEDLSGWHWRDGRHSHEGAQEDRRGRGGVCEQPLGRKRQSVRRGMGRSALLDESGGVPRSSRRRRRDSHNAKQPARGAGASGAGQRQTRPGRDSDEPEPARRRTGRRRDPQVGEGLHGHAYTPVLVAAPRDSPPDSGRNVPSASHGGRDLLLPPREPQHARRAAIVGGQPAVAPRVPLGRYRQLGAGPAGFRGLGRRKDRITRRSASRWT